MIKFRFNIEEDDDFFPSIRDFENDNIVSVGIEKIHFKELHMNVYGEYFLNGKMSKFKFVLDNTLNNNTINEIESYIQKELSRILVRKDMIIEAKDIVVYSNLLEQDIIKFFSQM